MPAPPPANSTPMTTPARPTAGGAILGTPRAAGPRRRPPGPRPRPPPPGFDGGGARPPQTRGGAGVEGPVPELGEPREGVGEDGRRVALGLVDLAEQQTRRELSPHALQQRRLRDGPLLL